jgi:hypothetical protein
VGGQAIEPLHWVETKPRFFVPTGTFSESDKKFRECKIAMLQIKLSGESVERWSHPYELFVRWNEPIAETPSESLFDIQEISTTEKSSSLETVD